MPSEAISKAVEHFKSLNVRSMKIPEWDLTVYAKNLTLDDRNKIVTRAKKHGDESINLTVMAIIMLSQDENGEKLFTDGDFKYLKEQCDGRILDRIFAFLYGMSDDEERAKN